MSPRRDREVVGFEFYVLDKWPHTRFERFRQLPALVYPESRVPITGIPLSSPLATESLIET
jgi:hypothetical protein